MGISWILLALSCLCLTQVQSNKYEGYKIYEVSAKARTAVMDQALAELAKNETYYEVFSSGSQPARIMVHPEEQPNFVQLMDGHSLSYKVLNRNVGRTLRRQFAKDRILRKKFPYQGNGRLGTERFYSHAEINQFIEGLAQEHPRRVFVKTVGKSYERRLMKTVTITNGDGRRNKNVIFVDGGFHAREWISPAAVVYLIDELVNNVADNADLLLDYDWVILPVVNPDGYEYTQLSEDTRMWRKTRKPSSSDCIGTDPNRNFDFHWNEEGASEDPCAQTYAGSKAFSEPEALVVSDLIHSYANRGKMYLTLHSYGPYILYPWGWSSDLPDTVEDLHEVAKAGFDAILEDTGTFYKIGSSTNVLYVAAGASDDYAFNAGFPISFTMELPPGGTGFDPPASAIDSLVKETWVGIAAMARKVVQKYPLA